MQRGLRREHTRLPAKRCRHSLISRCTPIACRKLSIVAHRDQGSVKPCQRGLQHFDRCQVEMIGRFVQQQEERRPRPCEYAGQSRPQPLAAAEGGGDPQRRLVAECEAGQRGVGFVIG